MSRLRLIVQCAAMAVNALCAGGVYSFPLVSPALVEHLRFNQSQLTTIALAGMVGQYPFAALVGKVLDSHGARICSLIAAMSFSIGFGLFAGEIAGAPDVMPKESVTSAFRRMVVYFALVGLGTVFSYFSVLFSATKLFPRYVGIASGTSMALFGCSPLIISAVADKFFTFPTPEPSPFTRPPSSLDAAEDGARTLNVTQFLTFLAILTGITHILGSLVLPGPAPQHDVPSTDGYDALDGASVPDIVTVVEEVTTPSWDESDETAPLLSRAKGKTRVTVEVVEAAEVPPPQHGSALDLVKDPYFWVLAGITAVVLGCSEMVIASMGSLFLSLPATPISAGILFNATTAGRGTTIARQVQLLSLTNTLSRLVIGPLADWAAPVPISMVRNGSSTPSPIEQDPEHAATSQGASSKTYYAFPRAHYVSRVAFMLAASILLMFTFLAFLSVNGSVSVEDVKAFTGRNSMNFLSIGVGIAYGSAFTVLPGIIASIYGAANLGRNFGIISYAPFVGTSAFSYLYAIVVDANSAKPQGGTTDADAATCRGSQCWRTTFAVAIAALGVAAFASMLLWHRWRGRV